MDLGGPGQDGEVYLTSLIYTGMPFIRYRLGDIAAWDPAPCSCGLWWPRLRIRQGRGTDVLALPDGRRVPITRIAGIVGTAPQIRQYQFVQTGPASLILRYAASPSLDAGAPTTHATDETVGSILRELRSMLPGVEIRGEKVDRIPHTATGKVTRFIRAWP